MLTAAIAYFLIASLCWNAMTAVRPQRPGPAAFLAAQARRRAWAIVAIVLAGLAVVRLVDVSSIATMLGRDAVRSEGWYTQRRPWQRDAIVLILAVAAIVGISAAIAARRAGAAVMVATMATTALLGFVAIRAVSLHQVDALLVSGYGQLTVSRVIEFGLLAVVALTAVLARRSATRRM